MKKQWIPALIKHILNSLSADQYKTRNNLKIERQTKTNRNYNDNTP